MRYVAPIAAVLAAGIMIVTGMQILVAPPPVAELGAWARVLVESGVHADSRGTALFLIVYGLVWLAVTWQRVRALMIVFALGGLWFLGLGALAALVSLLALLFFNRPDGKRSDDRT